MQETGHILFDEYVADLPTYQAINRDKIVTEEELAQQATHVVSLLRRLQSELRPELQELAEPPSANLLSCTRYTQSFRKQHGGTS